MISFKHYKSALQLLNIIIVAMHVICMLSIPNTETVESRTIHILRQACFTAGFQTCVFEYATLTIAGNGPSDKACRLSIIMSCFFYYLHAFKLLSSNDLIFWNVLKDSSRCNSY